MPNWLLPENIADVLPSEARKIEELRRLMLDTFRTYGYELVMPPLLEYVDSLLAGAGQDTDLRTFKLVDSMSGRLLGLRADMTTQVARIDAHLLNRDTVTRLCYAGSVLHTQPSGLHATREPLQIAFKSLQTDDQHLRGTALEYLDGILPARIRERLWPFLEQKPTVRPARPREEVIAELLRSHHSITLNLEALYSAAREERGPRALSGKPA